MSNAVAYFLNYFKSSAGDKCKTFFDFSDSTNVYVKNISGQTGYLNGDILPSVGNFWQNSGSGLFSGNYVKIATTGDINFADATYAMVYKNTAKGGCTLISTIEQAGSGSNAYYKGFEFGVTANNYLYFEYFTNKGPQVFTSNSSLSDKCSVYLSIVNGAISFGSYDFFKSSLNSVSFPIESDYIFNPSNIYLGYNDSITGSYNYNKQFTGYMDNFLIFSPSIYGQDIRYLNSGFVHDYTEPVTYVEYKYITGVTGYATGYTGYYSTVTGQMLVPTGVVNNCFGMSYTGYSIIDLTGVSSGINVTPLTGITNTYSQTGTSGEMVILNSGYITSLGKNKINILANIDEYDIVDISLPDNNYPYNVKNNLNTIYNSVDSVFTVNGLSNNSKFIVFANGLAQNSGNFYITGGGYNTNIIIDNDYIINRNRRIVFGNGFNQNDNIVVDEITGEYNSGLYIENFNIPELQQGMQLNWPTNYNIFYNGQKLISGIEANIGISAHYGINNSGIYFKNIAPFSGQTGQLFALPRNFDYNITGNFQNFEFTGGTFFNNYSEVYLNGVRQSLGGNYIELANSDINNGYGIFDIKNQIIYNNNYI